MHYSWIHNWKQNVCHREMQSTLPPGAANNQRKCADSVVFSFPWCVLRLYFGIHSLFILVLFHLLCRSGFSVSCYYRCYPNFSHQLPCLPHIFQSSRVLKTEAFFTSLLHYLCREVKKTKQKTSEFGWMLQLFFSNCIQQPFFAVHVKKLKTLYIVHHKYHQLPLERKSAETANQQCVYFIIRYIIFYSLMRSIWLDLQ